MKLPKVYSFLFLLLFFLSLTNCGGGSDPSAEEKIKKILVKGNGTWEPALSATSITLDGVNVADELFEDFTIRFTNDEIITTGTTPVWLREDTWSFKPGSKGKIIIRGMDNKEISITEISSAQLKITLLWDETTYGDRKASLPGLYEFTLSK